MTLTTTPQQLVTTHTPHTYLPCTARGTRTPIPRRMLHPRPRLSLLMVAVVWFATYRPPIPGARSTHGTATGLHGPESSPGRSRPAIKIAVDRLGMMHHLGNNNLLTAHMVDFEHSPRRAGTVHHVSGYFATATILQLERERFDPSARSGNFLSPTPHHLSRGQFTGFLPSYNLLCHSSSGILLPSPPWQTIRFSDTERLNITNRIPHHTYFIL